MSHGTDLWVIAHTYHRTHQITPIIGHIDHTYECIVAHMNESWHRFMSHGTCICTHRSHLCVRWRIRTRGVCVLWLIHMCGAWLIHMCEAWLVHVGGWHDSITSKHCLYDICMCHDSFTCAMTHLHAPDSFIGVIYVCYYASTCVVYMCGVCVWCMCVMAHSYVWGMIRACACVTWRIQVCHDSFMCAMTHLCVW